jgi:hypothetical protein
MSGGGHLRSLALLAVGQARLWQARLPSRFELEEADDGTPGEAWGEEISSGAAAPWELRIERHSSAPAPDPEPAAPAGALAPAGSMPIPAAAGGESAGAALVRPHPVPDDRPPRQTEEAVDAGPPGLAAEAPAPRPVLHVTLREIAAAPPAELPAADGSGPAPDATPGPAPGARRRTTEAGPGPLPVRPASWPGTALPAVAARARPEAEPTASPPRPAAVHVRIDRVEVQAVAPPSFPHATRTPERPAAPRPGPDLERYLREGSAR